MTDAQLCAASRQGQSEAFVELVRRYQGAVCAVTVAATGQRALSEDLAQDTFVIAWKKIAQIEDPQRVGAWLCGIARNLCRRTRRDPRTQVLPDSSQAHAALDGDVSAGAVDPEEAMVAQEQRQQVWRLLETLPVRYREAMVLYYRGEQSAPRVAELLGISTAAAEQRLSRGRRLLRDKVDRELARELSLSKPGEDFTRRVAAALPMGLPAAVGADEIADAVPQGTAASQAAPALLGIVTKGIVVKKLIAAVVAVVAVVLVAYAVFNDQPGSAEGAVHWSGGPDEPKWSVKTEANRDTARGAVLSGSVVEAGSGAPLSNSVVTVTTRTGTLARLRRVGETGSLAVTRTDEQGRWTMGELPAGRYTVTAAALGYLPGRSEPISWSPEADLDLRLELGSGGHRISGVVSDLGGGPIEGAVVRTRVRGSTVAAMSDEQGRYALTLPDGRYTLHGWEVDYQPADRSITVNGRDRVADLTLVPGSSIVGTVLERSTGEPVAGSTVLFYVEQRRLLGIGGVSFRAKAEQWVVTDAQGRFALQQLGAGEYKVVASADHLSSFAPANVSIGIAQQQQGVVVFVEPAHNVRGRVVDRAQPKTGMAEVTIEAVATLDLAPVKAVSDSDGSFELRGLVPGTYSLLLSGDGFVPSALDTTLEVSDADRDDVVLLVERGAVIRGRIEPAQVATVRLEPGPEVVGFALLSANPKARAARGTSDESGAFELSTVPTGEWTLIAEAADGSRGEVLVEVPDEGLDGVSVELGLRSVLAGRLVDEAGVAIADATVSLYSDADTGPFAEPVGTADTDGTGGFELRGLSAGRYRLSAHHRQGDRLVPASAAEESSTVAIVLPQEGVDDLELVMTRPQGMLAGVVLDPDGGPLADAWVVVYRSGGESEERAPLITDADGRFELRHLAEGAYTVYATSSESDAAARIDVPALRADLQVKLVGFGTLSGRVTKGGTPVTRFDIDIEQRLQRGVADAEGRFSFERVEPGSVVVTITASEGSLTKRVEVTSGATAELAVELGDWATVKGRALYPDGTPAADVEWQVLSRGGERDANTRLSQDLAGVVPKTDASGRFTAEGIGPGRGTVTFGRGLTASTPRIGGALFYAKPGATVDIGDVVVLALDEVAPDERGTLGLSLEVSYEPPPPTETAIDEPSGPARLWVTAVEPGGPAERAGLAVGDEVVSLQRYEVESLGASTVAVVVDEVRVKAGARYAFVVSREGAARSLAVTAAPGG